MTIEERLKRIEEKLGMSWGCREPKFQMVDQFAPKQATIKIGPMSLDHAEQIRGIIRACGGAVVDTDRGFHAGFPGNKVSAILTITGPAAE